MTRQLLKHAWVLILLGLASAIGSSYAQEIPYPLPEFVAPKEGPFQKVAQFWIDVYSKYGDQQGLIHDTDDVTRVYEVVDLRNISERKGEQLLKKLKAKWHAFLIAVHKKQKKPESMNEDELRVYHLFPEADGPKRFLKAASPKRMRFQAGQKDHFESAVMQSGRYLALMEDIFRADGIPIELTRLPFVESSFNLKARSKVGASGIWQFMRTTGRFYLKINPVLDERNDPIRATEAAARLLKQNYDSLQSWPLAVVAYNHGRMGLMRAVRKVGSSDLRDVLFGYKSRSFGFASRNFFWELVAAIHVEHHREKYFGKIDRMPLAQYTPVTIADYISGRDLAQGLGIPINEFEDYNPAFQPSVFKGLERIPPGYPIRIPDLWGKDKGGVIKAFEERYALIPPKLKHPRQH